MTFQKWRRILAPTDLSAESTRAVAYAHGLAVDVGAELHVLHVVQSFDELAKEHGVAGVIDADPSDESERWLATLLGEPGTVRRVEAVRLGSDAADVISKYAREHAIDLVVTATHGRSGVKHLLMGSVAEKLVRHSPCPVLVIRPGLAM